VRTVVLADVHLTRMTPPAVAADLAAFVRGHAGACIVVAGDLFDLSAERPTPTPREAFDAQPVVLRALGEHVTKGGELWLAAGNHDGEVEDAERALVDALALTGEARARVRITPWFFRVGDVHVEHGHLYDPDNAPAHPLVGGPSLGVHFVREFIAPTGAYAYLNENDGKPLELFLRSFTRYGARAPYVIYRFFHAAATALGSSGPFFRGEDDAREGDARVAEFAEACGVDAGVARRLAGLGPRPTLASWQRTFARLYLDRVAASLALLGGGALLAAGHTRAGVCALGAGALVMATSWALGHDRYGGSVVERLSDGARLVRAATGARAVVFGHTHRELCTEGYANTGSFAFARGEHRPFVEIEGSAGSPRLVSRGWPKLTSF
jgi:predicted phosphodiesterase